MGCFHLVWSVIAGFIVGLLARALMPGPHPMGIIATTALGIGGSLVGGVIGHLLSKPREGAKFHRAGFILSLIGALVVLFVWSRLR
jgi:uncharacterized membrane protein YeaQ/YmgE (transglycosylase-associated protein family)